MGIFGSNDDQSTAANSAAMPPSTPPTDPSAMPVTMPAAPTIQPSAPAPMPTPMTPPTPVTNDFNMTPPPEPQAPVMPPTDLPSPTPTISSHSMPAEPSPVMPAAVPSSAADISSEPSAFIAATDTAARGDLSSLKQQALQQLSPLVSHLDQSPEERFQTTMMMLQATDDQSLIKVAYDTAQEITDEKARAQALLDVINEINYFTQHKN